VIHTRPDRDGQEQLGLLGSAWEEAVPSWQDEVARQFDMGYWTPLVQRSTTYLEALRALMDLLETADRDTDF
jgi:hypothetical protein